MNARSVKLHADLVRKIKKVKPKTQTIADFVRDAVEHELRRRIMRSSAEAYQKLLRKNKFIRQEMEEWERANLTDD